MPIVDTTISLAFSIYSKKGIYALLVGSGLSRAAGIPTGWEITLDFIRKLAAASNEDCEPSPQSWYVNRYGEEPSYSKILRAVGSSPSIRNQLLRGYFEPTDDERKEGLKAPTQAHESIANLVKSGFIKVILTTNFDRLIEKALEKVGITPAVISTTDAIRGALPLPHTDCIVIKLHGDYIDTRIKNSPEELERYSRPLNKLIDRIFDEYGLLVCGWSAEWDIALRDALARCKSHRFETFWSIRGNQGNRTNELIALRKAEKISIIDANSFFKQLEEKILALDQLGKPHPLSVETAIATLKSLLRGGNQDIRLHDFLTEEVERTYRNLSANNFPTDQSVAPFSNDALIERVKRYESYTEILLSLLIVGCRWGKDEHVDLWIKSLERIANPSGGREGLMWWINLRYYPALLLLYGCGISSIASEGYGTLGNLLVNPKVIIGNEERPIVQRLIPDQVIELDHAKLIAGGDTKIPWSIYFYSYLREFFEGILPSDIDFQKCFDRFEYLFALVIFDFWRSQHNRMWGPGGYFLFRHSYRDDSNSIAANIFDDIAQEQLSMGENWPFLRAGVFNGSAEMFQNTKEEFDNWLREAYQRNRTIFDYMS
ncbi:SIR2 family protein [Desulfobacterota bacterium AH_259_B03_O07]|nr:SIR2 family protein [Desulfobacterota bacterium AH_259_B03_O07]